MYPVFLSSQKIWEGEGPGHPGVPKLGREGWSSGKGCWEGGKGEGLPGTGAWGGVPLLHVCLASLACPVLPEGRNRRNTEKRTRLTRGLGP